MAKTKKQSAFCDGWDAGLAHGRKEAVDMLVRALGVSKSADILLVEAQKRISMNAQPGDLVIRPDSPKYRAAIINILRPHCHNRSPHTGQKA